jgi:hypothetical protein
MALFLSGERGIDTMDDELRSLFAAAINSAGRAKVLDAIKHLAGEQSNETTLTIIVNAGVHHLADEYLRGDVFECSRGSLDLASSETVHAEFRRVLISTARKLKSRAWSRVYIVPFGPATLSMQVKLLVYRICGLESIDVMNISGKPKVDLTIDLRQLIIDSDTPE